MKAVMYEKSVSPVVVQIREIPRRMPKANRVLIRVDATMVTRGDVPIRYRLGTRFCAVVPGIRGTRG